MLTEEERQYLLHVARRSIESVVNETSPVVIETRSKSLMEPCGAFVTLRVGRGLRGCIGYIEPIKPLVETVQEVAAKAAIEDMRFTPVTPEELSTIEIEISVLSPLKEIHDPDELKVGEHGIIIEHGRYRGLLLPQVATEYGWDRETFLSQGARKAGLPTDAWRDPETKIYVFTAEVFGEHSSALANS